MSQEVVLAAYRNTIHNIGIAMKHYAIVQVHIGVGLLCCNEGVVISSLTQQTSSVKITSPRIATVPTLSILPRTSLILKIPIAPTYPRQNVVSPRQKRPLKKTTALLETYEETTTYFSTEREFPHLLDCHSRTRGAEAYLPSMTLSNRIGHHFSLAAGGLEMERRRGVGVIFRRQNVVTNDLLSLSPVCTDSEEHVYRYLHYLQHLDMKFDLPLVWSNRVVALLPEDTKKTNLSQDVRTEIKEKALVQMSLDFTKSIQKSILDYMLQRPETCLRIHVPGIPTTYRLAPQYGWGQSKVILLVPCLGWKKRKAEALLFMQNRLMLVDSHVLALQYLWQEYSDTLLVDMSLLDPYCPLCISTFVQKQRLHMLSVKNILVNEWFQKCQRILSSARNEDILSAALANPKEYFDCIATLMSLQLQGLIYRSIDTLVSYFQHFAKDSPKSSSGSPALMLTLESSRFGKLQLSENVDAVVSSLLELVYEIPASFTEMERVELTFSPSVSVGDVMYLWSIDGKDDCLRKATSALQSILVYNMDSSRALEKEYASFEMLLVKENELEILLESPVHWTSLEMKTFQNAVSLFYTKGKEIQDHLVDRIPTDLFVIDCSCVNAQLLKMANERASSLLHDFANRTSRLNDDLRVQYKTIKSTVSKKPTTLQELVQAETFVEALHSKNIQNLEMRVQDIQAYVLYLYSMVRK